MQYRRRTPQPRTANITRPPWVIDGRQEAQPGACNSHAEVLPRDVPSRGYNLPIPFDLRAIVPTTPGTRQVLIGVGGQDAASPVPHDYRCFVYGISPYLENAGGALTQARIPGAGVSYTWRLLLDGQPTQPYAAITQILAAWDSWSPTPLLEVPEGRVLTADVLGIDPGGTFLQVGLRIRGRWEPWTAEGRR